VSQLRRSEQELCAEFTDATAVAAPRRDREVVPEGSDATRADLAETGWLGAAPSADTVVAPLENIGRYLVKTQIGSGGFGTVYRCRDRQLNRDVAVKVLCDKSAALHEARAAASIDSPYIVRAYDFGHTDRGDPYIVFEYVEGETLETRIRKQDYDAELAAEWIRKLAGALHDAHTRHLIHRDVKPANVIIDADGNPRLTDFGLCRRDDQFFRQERGLIVGTLRYMSPEQLDHPEWADARTDIYSLGVVYYQLLCGEVPFSSDDLNEICAQIRHRDPEPPRNRTTDMIDQPLEEICLKAIEKDPANRYKTAGDMARDLERAAAKPGPPRAARFAYHLTTAAILLSLAALLAVWLHSAFPKKNELIGFAYPTIAYRTNPGDSAKAVAPRELPRGGDQLNFHARLRPAEQFSNEAFLYVILFHGGEAPQLLWPPREQLDKQEERMEYEFAHDQGDWLKLPDRDGVMLILFAATKQALDAEQLSEAALQQWRPPVPAPQPRVYAWDAVPRPPENERPTYFPALGSDEGAPPKIATGHDIPHDFEKTVREKFDTHFAVMFSYANQ
jgi:tRNA A-37 threonylcarbamoyl transferase component Bud32